ncbi:MAG: 9-cis-epoxycarotenoid dioxygenase [Ilumatobacteraceae bacterium]|nr:9-cis-epoxycarotenoid dioxygenase [Ilumatobacteraceae bacterium]
MRGNFAPVMTEVEAFDLPVEGTIPLELNGRYIRNGANPKHGVTMHWFAGDGMLHGVRLRDGRAEWYRNRWVRTRMLEGAQRRDPNTGVADLTVGLANTHIVRHAGRIFALEEGSLPNEITPDLDTLGPYDFDGRLNTAFTAHPHVCAETGEMHFFGYELVHAPFVTYHVADATGQLIHSQPIDVPGATMVHDFALSRNHAIFLDMPVVFDLNLAIAGTMPFLWSETYGARIGLLNRDGARRGEQPRWFDVDPCYVFHIMNAWESDDGQVVHLDAGRHASMWRGGPDAFEPSYLHRWSFDLRTGVVTEQQLDDLAHGFPRIDDRRTGLANRYGWATGTRPGSDAGMHGPSNVFKYDLATGQRTLHDLGPTVSMGEPVFVPAGPAAGEDEGYLVTFIHDDSTDRSSLVVLDAHDMSVPPLATVALPQRVPVGFHGSWFADQ